MSTLIISFVARSAVRCVIRNFVFARSASLPTTLKLQHSPTHANARLASSKPNVKCWKCGQETKLFFCNYCNSLQRPKSDCDFFSLFELPITYNLDAVTLAKKFKELQTEFHPDKFSNACEEEKSFSADLSATINRAYRTLVDPLERGLYMLQLNGEQISEESSSSEKAFLLQVMELNEDLELLQTKEEISKFGMENKDTLSLLLQEVTNAFEKKDIKAAKDALIRMKYFTSLQDKIKSKLYDLDIDRL